MQCPLYAACLMIIIFPHLLHIATEMSSLLGSTPLLDMQYRDHTRRHKLSNTGHTRHAVHIEHEIGRQSAHNRRIFCHLTNETIRGCQCKRTTVNRNSPGNS